VSRPATNGVEMSVQVRRRGKSEREEQGPAQAGNNEKMEAGPLHRAHPFMLTGEVQGQARNRPCRTGAW